MLLLFQMSTTESIAEDMSSLSIEDKNELRPTGHLDIYFMYVDGAIGSGKSTLIDNARLSNERWELFGDLTISEPPCEVILFKEPTEAYKTILDHFYTNPNQLTGITLQSLITSLMYKRECDVINLVENELEYLFYGYPKNNDEIIEHLNHNYTNIVGYEVDRVNLATLSGNEVKKERFVSRVSMRKNILILLERSLTTSLKVFIPCIAEAMKLDEIQISTLNHQLKLLQFDLEQKLCSVISKFQCSSSTYFNFKPACDIKIIKRDVFLRVPLLQAWNQYKQRCTDEKTKPCSYAYFQLNFSQFEKYIDREIISNRRVIILDASKSAEEILNSFRSMVKNIVY